MSALTKRQQTVILALLNGMSARAAGRKAGLSERTVYRLKREPEFQRELSDTARALFSESLEVLRASVPDAVAELVRLRKRSKSEAVRLRAVQLVFSVLAHADLDDVLDRLERLEERGGSALPQRLTVPLETDDGAEELTE